MENRTFLVYVDSVFSKAYAFSVVIKLILVDASQL